MASFTSVTIMGNLTRDVEVRNLGGDRRVANFSLAVNKVIPDRNGGEPRKKTSFFDVEAWGRTADNVAKYKQKGDPLLVHGELSQDVWQGEDGKKHSRVKIMAREVLFLHRGGDGGGGGRRDEYDQSPRREDNYDQRRDEPRGGRQSEPEEEGDNIPF